MTEGRSSAAAAASLWERDAEIATVTRTLDVLRADQSSAGSLLVFRGEAGLGKTALLTETRRIAERRGCTVWSARGGETLKSVPFNVVRQLLQPALVSLLPEEAREYLGDWYDIAGPALGIVDPGEGSVDPQYVCDGLVAAVRRLARREWPLVLIIDDAHWADQETLRWLAAFAERLDDLSVLVVVARRPGEVSGESARHLEAIAAAAGRPVNNLSALTPEATAGLTRATVGRHADDPFCREVWAVTGGNPYDTVELLAKVLDSEVQPVESRAGELRALNRAARGGGLVDRLNGLGIDATQFAWAAAILGTGISVDLVARLASMSTDVAERCAELLRTARILTEPDPAAGTETEGGELEFVHPLIASAVYNSIPPAVCTAMHGVAAQILTETGHGAAEASRHLLKVHPDDDEELVEQLREAAREHLAVGAPDAARRCLERALEEPPRPEVHAHVLLELGHATLLTAPSVTIEHLQSALVMPGLDGGQRVDAVVRLSQALLHNDQLEEAVRTVEAEAARHDAGPVKLRLQAVQFMWEGIHGETVSQERSRRLAELAGTCTGRDNSERALLILRGFDAMTHGENAEEVLQLCDRALVNGRLAPGLGWTDGEWGIELLMMLGSAYAYADRLDRAESLFAEALRAYTGAGWRGGHLSLANAFLGLAYRRQGRLRDAETTLREALNLAERVGRGLPLYWSSTCGLVDTLLARGHVEEAWSIAEQYGFAPPYPSTIVLPDIRSVRGRLLLAVGRTEEGINELEAAEKTAASRGGHNPVLAPWSIDLAKALATQDPARAAQLAADARRQAERFGTDTAIGEALRCAAALETGQRAVRLAAQAVAYLEASPCQYEHAAARVEYGIAIRSVAELNRGLALARSIGADGLVAQAREVLETGRGLR
ncbi:AAA family ATPase [Streptomyces sp. Ag109_G2-15]|uniref:ATP-binding protein n=1 Tax=Streptomyces sp. Ag109_G2-15 TaxID=1938850 RepID=UPI000BD28887|nr:AAA family ATPase [Streptomyces sp. Ag109_G2-15]SOE07808.1 AAA ATPase domain-containing protein [Streptomyces sp. Ag109_G2-15]